eukprot:CAMPEP_0117444200 /NCGR_PEP_ID=MMETSP0759-20121206/5110_1 /TAXON_ID=63605 /ORGANISM="Percolomonas cosmopolitus, Strain WS" /LENGTH=228 /DNA_ID=CAMNT_0005236243 /DNA_START=113 /DNA_END=795 /DNA_ORIENTATION=+
MSKFILTLAFILCLATILVAQSFTEEDADTLRYLIQDIEADLDAAGFDLESDDDLDMRSINTRGLNLIKSFEGFRSCKYNDVAGYPTIGYGHLIKRGESFSCITKERATSILRRDAGIAERCIAGAVKVRLNDNQFGALTSWAFNVGCGAARSSTLVRLLNQGKYGDVCAQLARWNKAGGRTVAGLTRRRQAECSSLQIMNILSVAELMQGIDHLDSCDEALQPKLIH